MPAMPFHLEKGHVLMAIESLLNDSAHDAPLTKAAVGLAGGASASDVLRTAAADSANPKWVAAINNVTALWFDDPGTYWIDYSGKVDEIVRKALLWAMQRAWDWDGQPSSFPKLSQRTREIHLWWHCSQRWFEAWLSWESTDGPVQVLFATPPHTGGVVWENINLAVAAGDANRLQKMSDSEGTRDMVLISQPVHVPQPVPLTVPTVSGTVPIPAAGERYKDAGKVGTWSIPTKAGGMNPKKVWP